MTSWPRLKEQKQLHQADAISSCSLSLSLVFFVVVHFLDGLGDSERPLKGAVPDTGRMKQGTELIRLCTALAMGHVPWANWEGSGKIFSYQPAVHPAVLPVQKPKMD